MGKEPGKPRGKMSSYAYFVQTCREEHKKKHPEASVNFAEFSKKCSERWKVRGDGASWWSQKPVIGPFKFPFISREMLQFIDEHWCNSTKGCRIFEHLTHTVTAKMKSQLPKYMEYFQRGFLQTVRSASSFCF